MCKKYCGQIYGENIPNLESKILDCFCEFVTTKEISFLGYSGEFRFAQYEDRKSVVAMCDVSNIKEFPDFVKDNLNIDIEIQPTHVTLYTLQLDRGIGLNSQGDVENKSIPVIVSEEIKNALRIG